MPVPKSKGELTRERILAEAAPLFNQRGYEGCSLNDIMAATGLEKGGIYRHFQNKEELAAEAFDYAWNFTITRRCHRLETIADPIARLKQHIANFATRSGLPGGCPLLNTACDSDNGNPILRERVRSALHGWQAMLHNVFQEGIRNSTIRSSLDLNATANHIISSLEGAILITRIERNDTPLRQALAQLDRYIETEIRQQN